MDELTVHGLPRVSRQRRSAGKLFWALIFGTGCLVLAVVLWHSIVKFWKYPFAILVDSKRHSSLQFPSITICDTDLSRYDPFKEDTFPKSCSTDDLANASDAFRHGCKLFIAGFHEGCVYDSGKRCSFPRGFSREKHWNFCYTFNKDGSVKQTLEDKLFGFEVMMLKNDSNLRALDAAAMPPLRFTHLRRGLALHVHSPDINIGFNTMDFIHLLPGHYTEVFVKRVVRRRLEAPYSSKCIEGSTAPNIVGGNYTVNSCLRSCLMLRMYEKCGDVFPEARAFMPYDKYPRRPKTDNVASCFVEVYRSAEDFGCSCPLPCYQEEFRTEVCQTPFRVTSVTPKMDKSLAQALNVSVEKLSLKFYQENIVRVNVFYESFLVETETEHPLYDVESLLGNVGGLMGLLIGASAISLVELIWLIAATILERFNGKKDVAKNCPK